MQESSDDILTISLSILHNYFNEQTKLFSDLYLKFSDTSAKLSFPVRYIRLWILFIGI